MIEHQTVLVNDVEYFLRVVGTGKEAMILLHGWPETSYAWRHIMKDFISDYKMLAPDLRGIGDTGKPSGPYDKATVAGDVLAIMDALDIEKAILVGHDIGARVAMRMTLDHPERVISLIILSGRYPPLGDLRISDRSQAMERWYFFFHQHPDLVEALVAKNVKVYYQHFLDQWSESSFRFEEKDVAEYVRAYSQPGSIRGACAHYQAALNEDVSQWVADIGKKIFTPTLVIWGENDPVSPTFYTDDYGQVFKDLDLHFIPKCGHFPQEEKPVETILAMRSFLKP
ncbi:MAG: alpha/beta hydrolase [Pseudomonadota bacterium]|nr:alpha/beta hydrolase [Pseudomonadota bacterium]